MTSKTITKTQARQFLVRYHGLDGTKKLSGEEGILDYIHQVGCIQYDPLNVVGRNPDLVLQSRIEGYRPELLHKLLYEKRSLIDGWDKMMAIYAIEDWAEMGRVRERHVQSSLGTMERRGTKSALELLEDVKKIIRDEGPKMAREIKLGVSAHRGRWGHGKLSSVALDYLYNCGELAIWDKRNTHKVYELIERVLEPEYLAVGKCFQNDTDFYEWYVERRIGSVGLLWHKNGGGWLGHFVSEKAIRGKAIEALRDKGRIQEIKTPFYMRTQDMYIFDQLSDNNKPVMRILAPLDNLLWDRGMIQEIFDFQYTWEVYVPKDKRKYGYYVLPVLYGDRFVGRLEPEKQRGQEPLVIKHWWWEEGIEKTQVLKDAYKECLKAFISYLGCNRYEEA